VGLLPISTVARPWPCKGRLAGPTRGHALRVFPMATRPGAGPGASVEKCFQMDPMGPLAGPGSSRPGRILGLDRDRLASFQSPGITPDKRRYPDMATVVDNFHIITSLVASF
jgi:hypothetical protein